MAAQYILPKVAIFNGSSIHPSKNGHQQWNLNLKMPSKKGPLEPQYSNGHYKGTISICIIISPLPLSKKEKNDHFFINDIAKGDFHFLDENKTKSQWGSNLIEQSYKITFMFINLTAEAHLLSLFS